MGFKISSYKVLIIKPYISMPKTYKALIYSTFLKSLRFGNDWFKAIDSDIYYKVYHELLDNILSRAHTEIRLAVLTEDPDTCLGWSICENKTLHYVFVKNNSKDEPSFRRMGIGSALLPKEFDQISHLTKLGRIIWEKKYPKVKFNPFQ